MTEYDYSPAAVQRHLETQNRIARWVSHTEAHHDVFCTPFGARSDIEDDDLDGMSEADEAIPSGASAGGWYENKRRTRGGYSSAPPPPPLPLFYQPQPQYSAPSPVYPAALASAPVGYPNYSQRPYMSQPGTPPQIIIQTTPKHRSSHRHHSDRHHHQQHSSRSSSSESRRRSSKSQPKMYVLPPPGSAGPAIQMHPSSFAQPPPGVYNYPQPQPPMPYPPSSQYPSYPYSPPGSGQLSPGPSPYYPQSGGYMIVPPKGKQIRVMYA